MAIFTWHNGTVPENMEIRQVYGLIFSRDGRILLRVEDVNGVLKYSLAGGHPEVYDKGIEETIRRELLEEINITITEPLLVGYQEVDDENQSPSYAQVRMTALIDSEGAVRPDLDNKKIYARLLVSPIRANDFLKWGEVGLAQINMAMDIASKAFGIKTFSDKEEYI